MSGRRIYLNIRHKLSQWLNPALCLSCGIPIETNAFICPDCLISLATVANACARCGLPNPAGGSTCPACLHAPPRWQHMIAPLVYQAGTRRIIHALKFNEQLQHANALLSHLHSCYSGHPVDALIPVPLHRSRLLERGFNQSEEIARLLSVRLSIPIDRDSLRRIKATESQSGLSLSKRQGNIRQAFAFNPIHRYQSVAIVDDVITTGSTVSEICRLLKKSGIGHIEVWSLARALRHE